ncbi:MAG: aminotransferase class I/II-fold pyridoxal phosphate-dependent enzyme [Bacillota bacterium]|nr:aminotransferase class I/II-fold pyridoxal phosphate-dependent enzyme [Bacillota bacterium]
MIFAKENGRTIPKEDKVFALSGRAKEAIAAKGKDAVINATIGALLDDEGELVTMTSVVDTIMSLTPTDYAEYAPIAGTPAFKEAVQKALFGNFKPSGHVRVCATPGGTGSITSVIANYSEVGDFVLTHDWCWANYKNICSQNGRNLATFSFFDDEGNFNAADLEAKVNELAAKQDQIVLMLNTPAHNPTGYSMTLEDWDAVIGILNKASCRFALFIDVAYIDYAGEDDEVREFMPKLEELGDNVLPIFGYSASKTLAAYGMRCGAIVCMTKDEETAEEFKKVVEYSARATWSNCNRAAQVVMGKLYAEPELQKKADDERRGYRNMLLDRGKTFEKVLNDNGAKCVPFDAGFFVTIACDDPAALGAELEKQDIYCVSLAKGIRVSIASISKEKCVKCAEAIAKLLK